MISFEFHSNPVVGMHGERTRDVRKVHTYCNQCVAGPDLVTVTVEDGVATQVEPCFAAADVHPAGGRACVKAFGMLQKSYNPNRLTTPMLRTNPRKGRDEEPGFRPVSWDEALDFVAARLREVHARGGLDGSGYPRMAVSIGGGSTPLAYAGTFPAFMAAWGPIDLSFGSGQGVKCTHSEHLYGEFWHRAFTVLPDTPLVEYLVSFGASTETASGVVGVSRHADARARGMKRVQVEPHLSVTGGCASEWIPIRPKTDAMFMLAMLHVAVHENPRARLDLPFLVERTSSPYLVAPNGFYLRDPDSRKPLVWDPDRGRPVAHDTPGVTPALEGAYTVSGLEVGADDATWTHDGVTCRTAFTVMVEALADHAPERAEAICDVPAARIRTVANEFLDHARIGETIVIDGVEMPFRPVSVSLGKTVNNGWGGFECCWARTMLACLVGALEVPGGTLGSTVRMNRPSSDRRLSVVPGPDGFMAHPMNPTDRAHWDAHPNQRHASKTLIPLVGDSGYSRALGPTHFGWMTQRQGAFPGLPEMTLPEVWITFRTNPAVSFWDTDAVAETIATFPFLVSFAYTHDETNHYADVLLPEATDLEATQLVNAGGTGPVEGFWEHQGFALRQPVVAPPEGVRDMTWIATELAKRCGLLEKYNRAINRGAAGVRLQGGGCDFSLDESAEHGVEAIWDAACRAASATVTGGAERDGLAWFRAHGFRVKPFPKSAWYLTPTLVEQGLRYELPYQERLVRVGRELGNRLHEHGIDWWDTQLAEYRAIPTWHDIPAIWDRALEKAFGVDIADYPFWVVTTRSMQFSWGANAGLQVMREVADNVSGHGGVVINSGRARELGIGDGDTVEIVAPSGQSVRGRAVLRQGIRPDTLLMTAQFNHWKSAVARDSDLPALNRLVPMLLDLTDNTGSGADLARAAVRRA